MLCAQSIFTESPQPHCYSNLPTKTQEGKRQTSIELSKTHPSPFVEEGLPAVDGPEGALAQLPIDDDPVPGYLPLVEGQERGGRDQPQSPHRPARSDLPLRPAG